MDYAFDENMAQKVRTGILGLDVQLGGGVPPGSTILLLAEPGASTEIFAQQFAYGGLTDEDNVYYLTSEQPVCEITSEMKNFGWNIEDYIESKKMRGMIPLNRTIPYNVTEKGIELETTMRAHQN